MKKILLILPLLFLIIGIARIVKSDIFGDIKRAAQKGKDIVEEGAKQVKEKGEEAFQKSKDLFKQTYKKVVDPAKEFATKKVYDEVIKEDIYESGIKSAYDKVKFAKEQADNYVNIGMTIAGAFLTENKSVPKPFYCNDNPKSEPPFVDSSDAKIQDVENLIPIIQKYSPILYLAQGEIYSPMQFSQYCCGQGTALMQQGTATTLMFAGTITPESIYKLYLKYLEEKKTNPSKKFDAYFAIQPCTTFGANPAKNKDAQGNLTTPAYVVAYEQGNNILLQFIFFYGYNGTFTGPLLGYKPLPTSDAVIDNLQGLHESDIEHVSMVIDKGSQKLIAIYYGAHGTGDGNWIDANNPDIEYQNGHPIVYPAKWSHGCYPKAGTWVRLYNLANDITSRGQRWTPKYIRIYPDNDPRFDPKTMGWIYVPGKMGRQGIDPLGFKNWFGNVGGTIFKNKAGNIIKTVNGDTVGRKYSSNFAFCKNPPSSTNPIDKVINTPEYVQYAACLLSKIPDAPLPPDKNKAVPPAIPTQLKPTTITVDQ